MLLYYPFIFLVNLVVFNVVTTHAESSESIVKPLQETDACRYKVWYLEICDPVEKKQVVHLILAEGGNNCEIVRHLTKDCTPSKENDHPVMPQKAAFKELLLSKNHSLQALEETIDKTESEDLPSLLKPGSSKLKESEATLLTEIKDFERQEDKTLQNMEETMSRLSTNKPMVAEEEEDSRIIRTTPNLPSSRRSIIEEVTQDGAIQEMEFITDDDKEQNQEDDQLFKNIEQELLENEKQGLKELKNIQDQLRPDQRVTKKPMVARGKPTEEIVVPEVIEPTATLSPVCSSVCSEYCSGFSNTVPEAPRRPVLIGEKAPTIVTQSSYDVNVAAQKEAESYGDVTKQIPIRQQSKYYGQRSLNLAGKSPNKAAKYGEQQQLNWKEKQNWVEKRFKDLDLSEAMNMSQMFKNHNASHSSKIINWMIKNMPDGKQTIIVL